MPSPSSSAPSPSTSNTTSVQVAVRIRPSNGHDATSIPTRFQRTIISSSPPSTVIVDPSSLPPSTSSNSTGAAPNSAANNPLAKRQTFAFDQVHDKEATQHAIFTSTAAPLVSRFLQGFNCTVVAYGQTSSGKTYTMTGVDLDLDPNDSSNRMGIIPRAVETVFGGVTQLKNERGQSWQSSLKGSFIEIYNEDLIDLLSADSDARREVQIREEKDGTIIWSGLREVQVKSTQDVMALIKQGSSIRRTNETDMNAQSSRSHAIFSLTLTQKKYTGTITPSRGSSGRTSPMPPTSPTASRLARPSSMYVGTPGASRVGSPTFGRPGTPSTPSFATAMNRASLRPQSSMSMSLGASLRPESPTQGEEAGDGSWVTVVSKFHFVDLAGSERLKRTAAQGDRIKEGISINSGLLALGNVISALGDPSRSRSSVTPIHVPYRDSKLTRLLQDSLGGNAHTLMIACVSPAEWNAAETVNTLKYANRARNIKNRAEVREKEEGWDDLEWLQGMITKLRKELKSMKEGGGSGSASLSTVNEEGAGTTNRVMLQKYHELQGMHEDLRSKYTSANEELRRAKTELDESKVPAGGNLKRYEEIVAPVIEQYEKTIGAMEAELKLNRTALAHTNEMYQEQEAELEVLKERKVTTEAYIEELRARVSKLGEREASTESYIRDLEGRLRTHTESSITSSDSITSLQRELAKHRTSDQSTTKYISDLEAKLNQRNADLAALRSVVDKFESQLDKKNEDILRLEAKVDALLAGGKDLEDWKNELEERERKVSELERSMDEWQRVREETQAERLRLGGVVQGVERQQRDLEQELGGGSFLKIDRMDIDGVSVVSASETGTGTGHEDTASLPPSLRVDTDVTSHLPLPPSPTISVRSLATVPPEVLRSQLLNLRKTHSATLEELATVSGKYRDSLKEISDLAGQIAEVKTQVSKHNTPAHSSQGDPPSDDADESGVLTPLRTWSPSQSPHGSLHRRRRGTSGAGVTLVRSESSPNGLGLNGNNNSSPQQQGRKLMFKHAASVESLHHARSQSMGLGQLESPVGSSSLLYGRSPRTPGGERGGDGMLDSLLSPTLPPRLSPLRMSLQLGHEGRSVESLEKEIMRLQEVLKEREAEITALEKNLQQIEKETSPTRSSSSDNLKPISEEPSVDPMTPQTQERFDELKKSLEVTPDLASPEGLGGGEDSMTRLNELMRAMAQKESQHHQQLTSMNDELEQVRRQQQNLDESSNPRLAALASELEAARMNLIDSKEQHLNVATQVESLKERERVLIDERRVAEEKHANEIEILRGEHEQELRKLKIDHSDKLSLTAEEHEDALRYATAKSRREAEVAAAATLETSIASLKAEHEVDLAKLIEQHEVELRQHEIDVEATLARARGDHERALHRLRSEQDEALAARDADATKKVKEELMVQHQTALKALEDSHKQELFQVKSAAETSLGLVKQEHQEELNSVNSQHATDLQARLDEAAATLKAAHDDHEASFAKVKAEHEDNLSRKAVEHVQLLQRAKDEHAANLRQAEIALQGSLSESQSVTADAMKQLQDEHTAAITRRDASSVEDLENLKAEHQRAITSRESDHQSRIERLINEHASHVTREQDKHATDVKRLQAELATLGEEQAVTLSKVMQELDTVHNAAEATRSSMLASHEEDLLKVKADHQSAMAGVQGKVIKAQELHRAALETARADFEASRKADVDRHKQAMADLEELHTSERGTLQKAHDLIGSEVERQKTLLSQARSEKEQLDIAHRSEVEDLKSRLITMEEHLASVMKERASNANEVEQLRGELSHHKANHTTNRESLSQELERHRSVLADLQHDLQRAKDAKDTLMSERQRQDAVVRDLQAQLASARAHKREGSGDSGPAINGVSTASRPARLNGLPPAKLPPLTAPPSVPPPPTPSSSTISSGFPVDVHANGRDSATSSTNSHSRAGSPDERGTPSTSVVMSPSHPSQLIDPKVAALIEEQAKHLEEQEAMIKTLNKQLTHCEADLQAHMDLVATLEASLTDSERSLRKTRMQSNELVKERDAYQQQISGLRQQVQEAQREVSSLRRSVAEEKLTLEHRLDEERKAKERARSQLDTRLEEISRGRKSKFCL